MKWYVLLKALPNAPEGSFFEENAFGNYNCVSLPNLMYGKEDVENNPEWFKLKEEIKVEDLTHFTDYRNGDHGYHFRVSKELQSETFLVICKAIETIANGNILVNADKKYEYTEEDMRVCWKAARERMSLLNNQLLYANFEDYIKKTKK